MHKRLADFFFKQKTAYEIGVRLVGSEMCIRDRTNGKNIWALAIEVCLSYTLRLIIVPTIGI